MIVSTVFGLPFYGLRRLHHLADVLKPAEVIVDFAQIIYKALMSLKELLLEWDVVFYLGRFRNSIFPVARITAGLVKQIKRTAGKRFFTKKLFQLLALFHYVALLRFYLLIRLV